MDTVKNTVANQQIFVTKMDQVMKTLKTETDSKIAELQKFSHSSISSIEAKIIEDTKAWNSAVSSVREDLSNQILKESENTKGFVLQTTNRSSAHRETLQVKYDEKLEKIKDVCAQYFAKYEKQLL